MRVSGFRCFSGSIEAGSTDSVILWKKYRIFDAVLVRFYRHFLRVMGCGVVAPPHLSNMAQIGSFSGKGSKIQPRLLAETVQKPCKNAIKP